MSYRITWKTHIICLLISLTISFLQLNNIGKAIIDFMIASSSNVKLTDNFIINYWFYLVLANFSIAIVHELIHGLAFKFIGCRVKYGFKGVFAYTLETTGKAISRTSFLIVLIAPVTVISLISVLMGVHLGGLIYWINLIGSTGDLLMVFYLCKIECSSRIIDKSYGFDVIRKGYL